MDTSFDEKSPVVPSAQCQVNSETVELTAAAQSAKKLGISHTRNAAAATAQVQIPTSLASILAKLPNDTPFQQQRLRAWQPTLSPNSVVYLFALISIIFLPIGIGLFFATKDLVDLEFRYDELMNSGPAGCLPESPVGECFHRVNLTIPADMTGPVYFYYKLSNYYQNHRIYVQSRSDYQLKGDGAPDISTCIPSGSKTNSRGQTQYPCGLIANSFFSDSFGASLCRPGAAACLTLGNITGNPDTNPLWKKRGIAWSGDVAERFKVNAAVLSDITTNGNSSRYSRISPFTNRQIPLPGDEDLMVWMRVAGLPVFRKLHRIIEMDLKAGEILQITINNVFQVKSFDGQKAIFLTNTNAMGGKNTFLGYCYVIVGCMTGLFAILFRVKNQLSPIKLEESDIEAIMEAEKLWRPNQSRANSVASIEGAARNGNNQNSQTNVNEQYKASSLDSVPVDESEAIGLRPPNGINKKSTSLTYDSSVIAPLSVAAAPAPTVLSVAHIDIQPAADEE